MNAYISELMSLGGGEGLLLDDAHDVFLAHDHEFVGTVFHFVAAVFAEEHHVADLHVERTHGAVFQHLALAYGDDFALAGLLGGAIRDQDAAGRLGLRLQALDDHPVVQWTNLHGKALRDEIIYWVMGS